MQQQNITKSRAILDLLESIDRKGEQSQRSMAIQFGVAVGLVNTYLKICVKKGYVKVKRLPSRRYVYMLTPKGMAEKLRLTFFLLSKELGRFQRARADYAEVFRDARGRGWRRVLLLGASELAEISALCALEADIEIVALVDGTAAMERLIGLPLTKRLADVAVPFDGALITDVHQAQATFSAAIAALGEDRVLAPAFFGFRRDRERAA